MASRLSCRDCVSFCGRKYNGIDYDNIDWCDYIESELQNLSACQHFRLRQVGIAAHSVSETKKLSIPSDAVWFKKHYVGKQSYFEGMLASKNRRDSSCKWNFH